MERHILEFYSRPTEMSSVGRHLATFDGLPTDIEALVRTIQHLVVYDMVAEDFYGVKLPKDRGEEIHIRPVQRKLDQILALDSRPLTAERPPQRRLAGRCHHYTVLLVSLLRANGVPARARCGFGTYFIPGKYEDHWVCEYWNADQERWVLVDAQLDEVWREKLSFPHDNLDVPRDAFLVAADAWDRCRRGAADPELFGIDFGGMRGLWFVAGDLMRDLAALNKVEMLPWDVWGAQPRPDEKLDDEQLAFFDRIAAVTRDPDGSFEELRGLFADERLRVPQKVFNSLRERTEQI
ncbi:transglutaminase-like domain-containing protein [Plantactinospora sp. GCM10030261]|uniref:transglutaminase-like domain-containing protein n=1 Tax=Plantactinospora sp. GCM10030261 TaxID=3273420 RepID=UPI0036109DE7